MARPKRYMCITECQLFIEVDGGIERPKRYRFGESIDADALPNHHFMEVPKEDYDKAPREIMEYLLKDLGIKVQPDWADDVLQRIYLSHLHSEKKKSNLDELKKKAKEIKAKVYHGWKDPRQWQTAIEEREKELSVQE